MIHKVDLSGDYETTIYDVARRLLSEGANPRDTVTTFRDGVISMKGIVGYCAKWRVAFVASGPRLERVAGHTLARLAGKTGEDVHSGMPGVGGAVSPELEHC